MTEQEEEERKVLEKIKAKMDRIKANQQKIQGASYKDTTNHYVGKHVFYLNFFVSYNYFWYGGESFR